MAKLFYLSLSNKELATLGVVSHEEIALYLIFKKLADFKTGTIGKTSHSKTNFEKLAELLSRPASQGKRALTYDRKDVSRMVDRMQLKGLVIKEPYEDKHLVLTLPMSPFDYGKKDEASKTAPGKEVPRRLPHAATGTTSAGLAVVEGEQFDCSPSVLFNTKNINTTISNDGNDFDDALKNQTLSVDAIKSLMASHPTIIYSGSEISVAIYHRWVKARVTKAELEKALEEAEADFSFEIKPNEIDEILRAQRKPKKRIGLVL